MTRLSIFILLILTGFSLTGQKVGIDREICMLALGDSYTIGQSVSKAERWPHQ